jgi:hypothetical protein
LIAAPRRFIGDLQGEQKNAWFREAVGFFRSTWYRYPVLSVFFKNATAGGPGKTRSFAGILQIFVLSLRAGHSARVVTHDP